VFGVGIFVWKVAIVGALAVMMTFAILVLVGLFKAIG
jgi:hypothetical protein